MSDRELLELAAKAVGMEVLPHGERWPRDAKGWFYNEHGNGGGMFARVEGVHKRWNPLTDDGDALRLAVKVGLSIDCWESGATVTYDLDGVQMSQLDEVGEPCAATRRAIVRAAAEIGSKP